MRKTPFVVGEFYHIYNRGTDHREIIGDVFDRQRFLQSIIEFNVIEPIGSIYEEQLKKDSLGSRSTKPAKLKKKLVNIIACCINPNHFHLILEQVEEKGIEKFMQRLGGGYTRYFNEKYHRSGVLFQGKFKSVYIDSDEYLLFVSAYVNLNDRIHNIQNDMTYSSWDEYIGKNRDEEMYTKDIILDRFKSKEEYRKFAEDAVEETKKRRKEDKLFAPLLIE